MIILGQFAFNKMAKGDGLYVAYEVSDIRPKHKR